MDATTITTAILTQLLQVTQRVDTVLTQIGEQNERFNDLKEVIDMISERQQVLERNLQRMEDYILTWEGGSAIVSNVGSVQEDMNQGDQDMVIDNDNSDEDDDDNSDDGIADEEEVSMIVQLATLFERFKQEHLRFGPDEYILSMRILKAAFMKWLVEEGITVTVIPNIMIRDTIENSLGEAKNKTAMVRDPSLYSRLTGVMVDGVTEEMANLKASPGWRKVMLMNRPSVMV